MRDSYGKTSVIVLLLTLFFSVPVAAQNYWLYPGSDNSVSLEMFKPKFDEDLSLGTLSTVWFLSGHIRAGDRLTVVLEMPISNIDWDTPLGEDQTLFGNPYIGIEGRAQLVAGSRYFVGRLGFRPPVASDDKFGAVEFGLLTTYHRFEAYFPDLITIYGSGGIEHFFPSGTNYGVTVGGALMIPTEDGGDSELFIDYSVQFKFPLDQFELGAGFAGRMLATEGDLSFGERTIHQLGVMGNMHFGNFRPGLHLRIPLDDDLTEVLDYVYGFNLTMDIP